MPTVSSCYAVFDSGDSFRLKTPSFQWSLSLGKGQSQNQAHPVFQTAPAVADSPC